MNKMLYKYTMNEGHKRQGREEGRLNVKQYLKEIII